MRAGFCEGIFKNRLAVYATRYNVRCGHAIHRHRKFMAAFALSQNLQTYEVDQFKQDLCKIRQNNIPDHQIASFVNVATESRGRRCFVCCVMVLGSVPVCV